MNKQLENYYKAIEDLTKLFCKKYFGDNYEYDETDWADFGEALYINDYRFAMNDIALAIEFNATKGELFGYYDYLIDKALKGENCVSFSNYLRYFRGFSFKEIEERLKERKKQ